MRFGGEIHPKVLRVLAYLVRERKNGMVVSVRLGDPGDKEGGRQ
jgi:hypothetical protein